MLYVAGTPCACAWLVPHALLPSRLGLQGFGKVLGEWASFRTDIVKPIERARNRRATLGMVRRAAGARQELWSMIAPFFLRRTKEQVKANTHMIDNTIANSAGDDDETPAPGDVVDALSDNLLPSQLINASGSVDDVDTKRGILSLKAKREVVLWTPMSLKQQIVYTK